MNRYAAIYTLNVWCPALESGEYTQTDGQLFNVFPKDDGKKHMCCLGVLCDKINPYAWDEYGNYYGEENLVLPPNIKDAFEVHETFIDDEDFVYAFKTTYPERYDALDTDYRLHTLSLAMLNDGYELQGSVIPPLEFPEIAALLRVAANHALERVAAEDY